MYERILNFVKNYLEEFPEYQDMTFRPGTGIWDLFVKAFAMLYQRILTLLDTAIADLDIRNYATMTERAMNVLGRMWFLDRTEGDYSYGIVRIYLTTPVSTSIPLGLTFSTADNKQFKTYEDASYSAAQIMNNTSGTAYYIDLPVKSIARDASYNVPARSISDIISSTSLPWTTVTNLLPITGGATHENNTEYYNRIVNSVNTRDLLITKGSVATSLYEAFPTFTDIEVVSAGDDDMDRDLLLGVVIGGSGEEPYTKSDFYGKTLGSLEKNKSEASWYSIDTQTPTAEDVGSELTNDEYWNLAVYDLDYFQCKGASLFSDQFELNTTFTDVDSNWIPFDTGYEYGRTQYSQSIHAYNGYLLIGETASTQSSTI